MLTEVRGLIAERRFAEASESLSALRGLSAQNVPALLAAYERATDATANRTSPAWEERRALVDQLTATLVDVVLRTTPSELASVDELSRRRMFDPAFRDDYRSLRLPRWIEMLPDSPREREVFVALGTCHPSGHIREQAMEWLARREDGGEIAFALLRVNDWVEPVRHAARRLIRDRLRARRLAGFVVSLGLVRRLRGTLRYESRDLENEIVDALSSSEGIVLLEGALDAVDRTTRRFAYELILERGGVAVRPRVVRHAILGQDRALKLRAMRLAVDDPELRRVMSADSTRPVRRTGVEARIAHGEIELEELRRLASDEEGSIRLLARSALARCEPAWDAADAYRTLLTFGGEATRMRGAAAGLAEVGERDDAAYVADHIASANKRLAREAILATGRLDRETYVDAMVLALRDPRSSVAGAAFRELRRLYVAPVRLRGLVEGGAPRHVISFALDLLRALDPWERLSDALTLADLAGPASAPVLDAWVREWLRRASRGAYAVPLPSHEFRTRVADHLALVPSESSRNRILAAFSTTAHAPR